MDYLGEIVSEPDPPGISNQRWIDLIRGHPNLEPGQPREGINPFTREPMTLRPRPDVAGVVIGGKGVGEMSWALDGSNRIDVFGEEQAVVPLAREIAAALGGRFVESEVE